MIIGTGTDLIKINRINQAILNNPEHFIKKIFTDNEQEYCSQYKNSSSKYANKFAAKESVCKALGLGIGIHGWRDIEVLNNENGKPYVVLHNQAKEFFQSLKGESIHVTITDTDEYSLAFCVIEK
jgi:holo-[acyl-carrier protein] synthase